MRLVMLLRVGPVLNIWSFVREHVLRDCRICSQMRVALCQWPRVSATAALPASVEPWRPAVVDVGMLLYAVCCRIHRSAARLRLQARLGLRQVVLRCCMQN